jgi:predicted transcriptional regulator
MNAMTIRFDDADMKELDWLARQLNGDKPRGLSYNEVVRIALRNEVKRVMASGMKKAGRKG